MLPTETIRKLSRWPLPNKYLKKLLLIFIQSYLVIKYNRHNTLLGEKTKMHRTYMKKIIKFSQNA